MELDTFAKFNMMEFLLVSNILAFQHALKDKIAFMEIRDIIVVQRNAAQNATLKQKHVI